MKDLTQGNEGRLILFFALPMLLGNAFQQLYNAVDSVVVGQFVGKQALAAVGQSFPVIFVFVALITGFGMATNVLVAQCFGARDRERLQSVVDTSIAFTAFFALAVMALAFAFAPAILRAMRTPADAFPLAVIYLRIVVAGTLPSFGYNAVSAVLRGIGDSKTPLVALIISTVLNIALDLLFVVAFGWGVAGVAIATVVAQAVSFAWVARYLATKVDAFRFAPLGARIDRDSFREIVKLGLPSGVQQALVGAGLATLTGVVNQFGTNPAAAYSVAGKLDGLAVMPAMSVSLAVASFTAQNLGARRIDRVRRGLRYALVMTLAISVSISSALFAFGGSLVSLFSADPEVTRIGAEYFRIVAVAYVAQSVMFCFSGVLRGSGAMVFTMLTTLASMWAVRVPLAIAFSSRWGTRGIWWAVVAGFAVSLAATIAFYLFGKWERKTLVREPLTAAPE